MIYAIPKKPFPAAPRQMHATNRAYRFIAREETAALPFLPLISIRRHKWGVLTYTEFCKLEDLTISQVLRINPDGFSIYDGENYTIIYNDRVQPGRILFTLTHEIGHIECNHFIEFEQTILGRNGLSKDQYAVLDAEADCFARNVTAPLPIAKLVQHYGPKAAMSLFGITKTAWSLRLFWLKRDADNLMPMLLNAVSFKLRDYIDEMDSFEGAMPDWEE